VTGLVGAGADLVHALFVLVIKILFLIVAIVFSVGLVTAAMIVMRDCRPPAAPILEDQGDDGSRAVKR
jgi:hypothetical protein